VSADYYARLEQGRERNPSSPVLHGLARALRLDADGAGHLCRLARVGLSVAELPVPQSVDPALQQLVAAFPVSVAYVLGPAFDVLACNAAAAELLAPFGSERNMLRILLQHPAAAVVFPERDLSIERTISALRLNAGLYRDDHKLHELVAELVAGSNQFATLWRGHQARALDRRRKVVVHRDVGRIELSFQSFEVRDAPGQALMVGTAPVASTSEVAVRRLSRRSSALAGGSTVGAEIAGALGAQRLAVAVPG
jgi:hypothetical protein